MLLAEVTASVNPLLVLFIGTVIVIGSIIVLRVGAFLGLISAAMVVSLLAPGEASEKISRVALAFGNSAGSIGIVIALASIIGKSMMDSGAADRIVRAFLGFLGVKRGPLALMSSGYVLSVPVFFDTVFYLLVPLARSMYRQTNSRYLAYLVAIGAGGAITHTLVPPTPGPLFMADELQFDVGMMILIGGMIGLPCSIVGMYWGMWLDKKMPIPMRQVADQDEPEPLEESQLPGIFVSLIPVVLPVLLILAKTLIDLFIDPTKATGNEKTLSDIFAIIGDKNFALFVSAIAALLIYFTKRKPTLTVLSKNIEVALMSGGVIILITAAGGAFGAMLKQAQVGVAIEELFKSDGSGQQLSGIALLLLAYLLASLLKISQGSGTVAMITATGMLAAILKETPSLPFHPVYFACAIGCGSLMVSWMNDSGFWIFAKMGGLTEVEALKSWTSTLAIMSIVGLVLTLLLATILPMTPEVNPLVPAASP